MYLLVLLIFVKRLSAESKSCDAINILQTYAVKIYINQETIDPNVCARNAGNSALQMPFVILCTYWHAIPLTGIKYRCTKLIICVIMPPMPKQEG